MLLAHNLFLLYSREEIFASKLSPCNLNFNYFFEKEKYNEGEEGFEFLFVTVR